MGNTNHSVSNYDVFGIAQGWCDSIYFSVLLLVLISVCNSDQGSEGSLGDNEMD
jgi:hypothetical protein